MRRLSAVIGLGLLLLWGGGGLLASAETEQSAEPITLSLQPSSPAPAFTLNLTNTDSTVIQGIALVINFDPTILQATDPVTAECFTDWDKIETDNSTGIINYDGLKFSTGCATNITVFDLAFTCIADGVSMVTLSNSNIANPSGGALPHDTYRQVVLCNSFAWGSDDLKNGEAHGVSDLNNVVPMFGTSVIELINAGPNGMVDPADCATSAVSGDDTVLATTIIGDAGYVPFSAYLPDTAQLGDSIYLRAWNNAASTSATHYGDSSMGTLNSTGLFNAPRWSMATPCVTATDTPTPMPTTPVPTNTPTTPVPTDTPTPTPTDTPTPSPTPQTYYTLNLNNAPNNALSLLSIDPLPQPMGYVSGTSVMLTAHSQSSSCLASSWAFGEWSGDMVAGTPTLTVVMNQDYDLTASYLELSQMFCVAPIIHVANYTTTLNSEQNIIIEAVDVPTGNLGEIEFSLRYDDSLFMLTDCTIDPSQLFDTTTCDTSQSGVLTMTMMSAAGVGGSADLAHITIKSMGAVGDFSLFDLDVARAAAPGNLTLNPQVSDGSIFVLNAPPTAVGVSLFEEQNPVVSVTALAIGLSIVTVFGRINHLSKKSD